MLKPVDRRLSIAPMLDWTDRYFRYFIRLISRHTLLYTEMVATHALMFGDSDRFLAFDPIEHPIALQLGGNSAAELAHCARLGEIAGYDEINLNLGCPSDRVQSGRFGACLMAEPHLVAACVEAMASAVSIPITAKQRIGIDARDSYAELCDFVGTVAQAGCETFIVHARKACLEGLSPKQNREIPPLCYPTVHRLKQDFPELEIVINGGITSLAQAMQQLQSVDGAMIGREAYHNPWILADADHHVFDAIKKVRTRRDIVEELIPFVERQLAVGVPLQRITRHILGLYHGVPGARTWRRALSAQEKTQGIDARTILEAANLVSNSINKTDSATAKP